MKLVIISGQSGSGKSTALQALEDVGFYCIDNLPAQLLPELVQHMLADGRHSKIAICIDARNMPENLQKLPDIWNELKQLSPLTLELLYLDAADHTLLKRYSSTRRRHPMSDIVNDLPGAIEYERKLLEPIANLADIRLDTTHLSIYDLRDRVKHRVAERKEQQLSLQFLSFGFKHGVPLDVDMVFDMRILPNPYWIPDLRQYSGLDRPVIDFLRQEAEVIDMIQDITDYLEKWLPRFMQNNRSYITVGIGCTGGHHRSVFIAESLNKHFSAQLDNVDVKHRELPHPNQERAHD